MRLERLTILAVCLMAVCAVNSVGQTSRGSLTGLVLDSSRSGVPGATVTLRSTATGEEHRTISGELGGYVFPSLVPGQYNLTVESPGFKKYEVQGLVISVGQPSKLNATLEIGTVSEEITVTGETQEVINSVSAVLSNTINPRQVRDLPLASRNPLDLARLQMGIAVIGDNTRGASVGGLRGTATNVTQDGVNAMDNFVKTSSFFAISAPSLNSTSEFSITVGTVGADAGRGVAQVRMVTPSGTNELHGNLFWQHRNDKLNANSFFNNATGTPRERELQNWFGFAVGGPVFIPGLYDGRNRSHWFFSYEGFREPFSVTRNRTVLTEEARKGIFRYVGSTGATESVDLLKIGNASALNSVTMAQLNAMPAPNNTLAGDTLNTAGWRYNVAGVSNNDKISLRGDQTLVENSALGSHRLEFVYHRAKFILTPDTFNGLESRFPGGIDAEQGSTRTLTAMAIHSNFGPRTTNEARFGHQRAPVGFLRKAPPDRPFFTNLGAVTDFDNTFMSQGRNTLVYHFQDNFYLVRGTHTFSLGVEAQSISAVTFNDAGIHPLVNIGTNSANPNGILNSAFPNLPSGSTGSATANRARSVFADITGFLASSTQTFNVSSPTSGFVPGATRARLFRQRDVSLYFQDHHRFRRNLTLNYGLRYEFLGVPTIPNGLSIQPTTGVAGLYGISGEGNLFKPGVLQGDPTTTLDFVDGKTGIPLYKNDRNNFAPFFGFAYAPSVDSGVLRWLFGPEGTSSIRGGYSISYLRDGFTVVSNALGVGTTNPGLIQTAANQTPTGVLTSSGVPVTTPTFKIPITAAENFLTNSNNGLWTFDPNLRTPYVQQWSFGIEREIAANTALEIRYVGNHAIKIFRANDLNEVNIFENGFLQEFLNAQKNLAVRGGSNFGPGPAGTVPLPILSTLFAGLSNSSGFGNSTFINNLLQNNVGSMAGTLAGSPTYRNNRAKLAPNFFRVNPDASFARVLTNHSFSNYHSLQMEIRRRFARGLQYQANYTFSKAMTDSNGGQSTLESFRTIRDIRLDRARSDLDQTHRFVSNFIYELPFGTGRRFLSGGFAPMRKLLEGWSVGSILNWQGRPPFAVYSGRSTFNNFNSGNNPAQMLGISLDEFKKNVGVYRMPYGVFFINPSLMDITTSPTTGQLVNATLKDGLLGPPDPGSFGDFPRSSINGPRYFKADFSIVKRSYFGERGNFEFRLSLLNAFNNTNFTFGDVTFDSSQFGRITGQSGDARVIHFALGINF